MYTLKALALMVADGLYCYRRHLTRKWLKCWRIFLCNSKIRLQMQISLFPILHKYYYDMYIAILLKKENKKITLL